MNQTWTSIILAVVGAGVLNSIVQFFKDRRKDATAADLADVQTLQAKLAYLESIAENLRKHNIALQADYDSAEERNRRARHRIAELEEELDKIKRNCNSLESQLDTLKAIVGGDQ